MRFHSGHWNADPALWQEVGSLNFGSQRDAPARQMCGIFDVIQHGPAYRLSASMGAKQRRRHLRPAINQWRERPDRDGQPIAIANEHHAAPRGE